MYEYKARLIRIVDGNTIEAEIDLGFTFYTKQNIRLFGVAGENKQTKNKAKLDREMARLHQIIPKEFVVQTILGKRSRVGRTMGVLYSISPGSECININEALIEAGAKRIYE